jgi:ParB family chromosome partitioning protein
MIVLGGYTNAEIAAKIDLTPDYIAAICYLLEHGEERLLVAVERGVMPANVAMEIRRASQDFWRSDQWRAVVRQ